MANCHHQRVPLKTLTLALALFLPCIACLAAIPLWTNTSRLVPSSSLQPLYHSQRQLKDTEEEEEEIYRPRPCYDLLCPGAASLQGRRPYQEDRVLFSPGLRLPLPAADESSSPAGLFGVFDGHLGEAASDFAAKSVRERFLYHSFKGWQGAAPTVNLSSIVQSMPLFESSLLAAISDIDATFGEIAVHQGLKSGSTACVALQVGNRILVANVGDSKAFFCSSCEVREPGSAERLPDSDLSQAAVLRASRRARHRTSRMYEEDHLHSKSQGLCVRHLSSDHRPDRPDEKLRIEASGGFVSNGSLPRVNGQLAVSRSIGDVDLRKYGVISEPELSGWRQVSEDDKFLILGSDGIFEKLSPQEVCHVMHAISSGQDVQAIIDKAEKQSSGVIALPGVVNSNEKVGDMPRSGPHSITSTSAHIMSKESHLRMAMAMAMPYFEGPSGVGQVLAQILVELAFRAGSMDNLSAVVVPLKVVAG